MKNNERNNPKPQEEIMEIKEIMQEKFESDTLTKIIPALIKAQKEMENIEKDGVVSYNGKTRNYSTIGSILNTIKRSLINNEIAFTQPLVFKDGDFFLYTNLHHSSGEFIKSRVIMYKHADTIDQDFGKNVTYSRRYAALCAVGCAPDELEDDDGETQKNNQQERPQYTSTSSDKISEAQLKMFAGRTQKNPECIIALMERYEVKSPADFKKRDFNNILIEIDNFSK